MKSLITLLSTLLFSIGALAAEKKLILAVEKPAPSVLMTSNSKLPSTLALNFIALSQGKTNVYFDVGGMSERVAPALSFRSYSNKEKRKDLNYQKFTVDRSLATLGASITVLKFDSKSLIVNPYLYFGTEKDAVNTSSVNGAGVRFVGQANFNKGVGIQAGIDANTMEGEFKGDAYVGLAFAL